MFILMDSEVLINSVIAGVILQGINPDWLPFLLLSFI